MAYRCHQASQACHYTIALVGHRKRLTGSLNKFFFNEFLLRVSTFISFFFMNLLDIVLHSAINSEYLIVTGSNF